MKSTRLAKILLVLSLTPVGPFWSLCPMAMYGTMHNPPFCLLGCASIPNAWAEEELDVDVISQNFFCTCGSCNLLLSVCETQMTCTTAKRMKLEVQGMIDGGMSEEEITAEMIKTYGDTVLAKPPMQGFTLALWWYPVIGGAVGILVIFMVSRRRGGVEWHLDPDESIDLEEEALAQRVEVEGESGLAVSRRYDDLLRRKLEEIREKKEG